MSSEMRELIAKWHERVDVDPTNDYLLGRSEMLVECASDLLALLARTEAGADGVVYQMMAIDQDDDDKRVWMDMSRDEYERLKDHPSVRSRILYTHPQDASAGWMPIETAPRDGTPFIGYGEPRRGMGYAAHTTRWEDYGEGSIARVWFLEGKGPKGGFWYSEYDWTQTWSPSHWQPLPAAPTGGSEK